MPLYEYRCGQCNHRFEKLIRSAAAADEAECPNCGSVGARRLVSTFAARFGSSFGGSFGGDMGGGCAPAVGGG
jgi:putative FmdB family regulatory protein